MYHASTQLTIDNRDIIKIHTKYSINSLKGLKGMTLFNSDYKNALKLNKFPKVQ